MRCDQLTLKEHPEVDGWLPALQDHLFRRWTTTTRHTLAGTSGWSWACEIAGACRACNEHLSLPCSLAAEGNAIASFLSARCYADDPTAFLRLYLIVLSEFCGQLEQLSKLMSLELKRKPQAVSLWANRWAKHRLQILLQHHPRVVFADAYGDRWPVVEEAFRTVNFTDKCGRVLSKQLIGRQWLEEFHGIKPHPHANRTEVTIVLVPPLATFLDEMMGYYRGFVDACLGKPEQLRQFEADSFFPRC